MSNHSKFCLVGDIGGTNARFALADPTTLEIHHTRVLPCDNFSSLTQAIKTYLADHEEIRPSMGCIAVAAPVTGDEVSLTNRSWNFSIRETRDDLGFQRFYVLNDFTALAMSLPHLKDDEKRMIGKEAIIPETARPIVVVGPGTGLGVSALYPTGAGDWTPISGEGGHIGFAPGNELEERILTRMRSGRGRISAERILSGSGLEALYQALLDVGAIRGEPLDAPTITDQAMAGDDNATFCLDLFCGILGRVAGDLALVFGAFGGVYIGGGIIPRFLDFFEKSSFRRCFEEKGRMTGLVHDMPTYVILAKTPALTGSAAWAATHGAK